MKKYIIILLSLFACSEETTYRVDAELQPYVDSFYQEASNRGVTLSKDNLLVVLRNDVQAFTNVGNGDGQKYIYFNRHSFSYLEENQIEYELYAGLSAILLGKSIASTIKGIDQFKDVEYPGAAYNEGTREIILDELF